MKAFAISTLLLLLVLTISAQSERPWEQLLTETLTADDIEADGWEDTYDMLCELEEQPLNLNTASREQLEALPFLSALQVEAMMEYLYRYGPMKSMNELKMIRQLDYTQIELLRHFAYVDDERAAQFPALDDILQHGQNEFMGNVRVPFYKRKGDRNGYLGYPYRHWFRYQYAYKDYVKMGVVGTQDAGEPFFADKNKAGYDFYSYYLQVRRLGCIENAIVGKYKLSAGMGLVVNNSFGLGKLAMLQQLGRNTSTVRPHSSRTQSGHMQGAAATLSLSPNWQLTSALSYRSLDATLNDDGTARTIDNDGYHRTPTEMERKNNTHATDALVRVACRYGGLHAGATALYTHLDRELQPNTATLYRRHNAQGNDFVNVSADYGYLHPRFAVSGETAVNRDGALATLNSLSVQAADGLTLMLLQRFFSYRYTALYARTVSEGGHVQNESGVYLGATWRPSPGLQLQAYTDYAYFPWARYQVSQASHAWDNLLSASYSRGDWTVSGRYRLHLRQKDDDTKQALDDYTEHRARLALGWNGGSLGTTTQADVISTGSSQREWGYMLSQALNGPWHRLKLSLNGGYFHTDGYEARLYVYERGPLYAFSFPAYYGEGLRLAMMANVAAGKQLTLTAKAGYTHYFDRSTIGSGLQEINSSSMTDLSFQLRWRF